MKKKSLKLLKTGLAAMMTLSVVFIPAKAEEPAEVTDPTEETMDIVDTEDPSDVVDPSDETTDVVDTEDPAEIVDPSEEATDIVDTEETIEKPEAPDADQPALLDDETDDPAPTIKLSDAAQKVKDEIEALEINSETYNEETALLSQYREPVVEVRFAYDKLSKDVKAELVEDGAYKQLVIAEAKVLNLWIRDLKKLPDKATLNMLWFLDEDYEALDALTEEEKAELVPNYTWRQEFEETERPIVRQAKKDNMAAADAVIAVINDMQALTLADKPEVEAARVAYDSLTDIQKAFVTNYELLKAAENKMAELEGKPLPHTGVDNMKYTGTRSSTYGPGTPWLSPETWGQITQDLTSWFPGSQSTMVWIIGALSSNGGITLEFDKPEWLTDEWLAEEDYRSLDYINFAEPTKQGHASHEEYLNYFDEHDIYVYLQVEPGYSDVETLMDILVKEYGHHKCVLGFGVDVEWYHAAVTDGGLPVTDDIAEAWDTHLKSLDASYRLFLKHYNVRFLPENYRSDIIFVNDSQGCGSMNGDVLGFYDANIEDAEGFIVSFKEFADHFYPNEVIHQIGYANDKTWYYSLPDSVVKSLGTRLAEVTKQNTGIAWVDFALKDALTFPYTMSETEKINNVASAINFFGSTKLVGKRFANGEATYSDALLVKKINQIFEALTEEEQAQVIEAVKNARRYDNALENWEAAQAKAIDIRIAHLSNPLREKDIPIIQEIQADYDKLPDELKAQVTLTIPDYSHLIKNPDEPNNPDVPDTPDTPDTPNNPGKPTKPQDTVTTGDHNYIAGYAAVSIAALGIVAVLLKKRRQVSK